MLGDKARLTDSVPVHHKGVWIGWRKIFHTKLTN